MGKVGYIPKQGSRTLFIGAQGAARRVKGLDKLLTKLAYIPQVAQERMRVAVNESADELVDAIRNAAPSSVLEPHPGALKASVHKEDGLHDLAVVVVADARDEHGNPYAAHVEFGHRMPGSSVHVPAHPFFYPTLARLKGRISRRMQQAITDSIRDAG